jgi:hypothetical protein
MPTEIVEGHAPGLKGRLRIRGDAPNMLPGNPMEPEPRLSPIVGFWPFNPEPDSVLEKLGKAYDDALAAVDAISHHKAEARKSGLFTDAGLDADALNFAASTLAPKLHRARQAIVQAQKEAAERRAKLTVPIDKSDTYGFVRRQRKLDLLMRLPEKQRQRAIESEQLDPELAQAILELEMPAEMLGLSAAACDLIKQRTLRAVYGNVIDELEQLDGGIALADRAIQMAREELAIDAGVELAKFDAAAKPYEKPVGPWLKRIKQNGVEEVRVLRWNADPKTGGTLQVPTPGELETGQFYADINEYREAHGLSDVG